MDEGSGDTITDEINSFVGTRVGSQKAAWVAGKFGQALEFTTGDNSLILDNAAHPASTETALSFSMWMYGADNIKRNTSGLYANGPSGRVTNIHFPWGNGSVYWDNGHGTHDRIQTGDISASLKGSVNGWQHFIFTKDRIAGKMEIFQNGVSILSGTGKTMAWGDPTDFRLGTNTGAGDDWPAIVDDFRIYNVALDATAAANLYNSGNGDLNGGIIIVETGGQDPSVKFYWGDEDGGDSTDVDPADDNKWDYEITVDGTHGLSEFVNAPITGLTKGTTYYFRAQVTNASGSAWAGAARSFEAKNTLLNKDTIEDLALWLDATEVNNDNLPDAFEDNDAISAWADLSGNNVTVEQTSTSAKPTYQSAQAGTKPVIRFDGTGDFLFVVGALAADGTDSTIMVAHQRTEQAGNIDGVIVDEFSDEITSIGNQPYAMKVSTLKQTGGTLKNIKIGKDALVSDKNFGGDIAEILVFSRNLSYQEQKQVEGYLAHKWGGTDSLTNSHPYKEQAPAFDNSPKIVLVKGVEGFDTPTRQGLLGEWLFDNEDANDTSGNNFHGTNNGGAYITDTPTGTGKAIDFNGGDKYVIVDDGQGQTVFNTGGALTTSFWVKEWPDGSWEPWVSKRGESGQGWQIRRYGGSADELAATLRGAGDDNNRVVTPVNDGDWHHIATVFGGGRCKIFVDGVKLLDRGQGGSINNTSHKLVFGARDNGGSIGNYSRTKLDDVRIFNRPLTDDEVSVYSGAFLNKIIGNFGNAFSFNVQATKGPDDYTVTAGSLPPGLTLNASTGEISGTPTQTGEFTATIKVTNSAGEDSRQFFFLIREGIQNVTFDQDFGTQTYGGADFDLTATSDATGADIEFYSKNPDVVTITGNASVTPTITGGLKIHWDFEDGTGTTATDNLSGNNGTLNNMDNADWVAGKFGTALNFDGTDDYVSHPKEVGGASEMTVSMWIKPTALANDTLAAKTEMTNTGQGWALRLRSDGDLWFQIGSKDHNDNNTRAGAGSINAGEWTHVAATWKARNAKIYVNGLPVTTRTTWSGRTVKETTEELWVGRSEHIDTGARYTGLIDDFRYYDVALPIGDIEKLAATAASDYLTTYDGGKAHMVGAGAATIVAFAKPTVNLLASVPVERNVIIGKATLDVTADSFTRKVNVANPSLTVQYSGFVNGDTASVLTATATATTIADINSPAGNYPITPAGAAADNYSFNYVNGTLTVDQRTEQTITFTQDFSSVVFGDTVALTATAGSGLPVSYSISDVSVAAPVATRQFHMEGWWKLDEQSGTTVGDSSGNNRSLVVAGTDGSTNWKLAKFLNGFEFDGTNDYMVNFGNQGILGAEKRSVSFWIKGSAAGNDGAGIVGWGNDSAGEHFSVELSTGKIKVDFNGVSKTGTTDVLDDAWHNVIVVYPKDGAVADTKIYVDGADDGGSVTGSGTVNTTAGTNLTIGRQIKTTTYFAGLLDDIRVYQGELKTNALTEPNNEITAIYNNGFGDFNKVRIVGTGTVTITASQSGNVTYAPAVDVSKTFNIGKLDQTIAYGILPEKSVGDFDFDPGATAGSGLPVHYVSSDPLIASVVGDPGSQKIRIRGAGTVTITATQGGNDTYNAAPDVSQTLTVNYFNLFADSIAGMKFWYDANDINADRTPDTNSDASVISTWSDRSGNNLNAIQGDVNQLVEYKQDGLNSLATVNIASGKTLNMPNVDGIKMLFLVMKQDAGQSLATKPFGGNIFATNDSGKLVQKIDGQYDLVSPVSSQQFNIITMRLAEDNQGFWVNGTFIAGDVNATAADVLSKIGNGFIGEFAEIVGYSNALPNLTRVKIEGYLASKWGLLGLLPGDHPHKITRPTFGGAQSIVFQPLSDKTPESAPFTLSAESGSGLPVSFASSNTSVATINGNVVTVHAEGTINITATQGGDANWFAATPAVQQLKVTAVPRDDQKDNN
jgi:hypothetical protein